MAARARASPLEGVRAAAPGKLILIGEHAAVYGSPAMVAAIDLGVTVELRRLPPPKSGESGEDAPVLRLDLDGSVTTLRWRDAVSYTEAARRHWRALAGDAAGVFVPLAPQGESIDSANRLVALALGEAWLELEKETLHRLEIGNLDLKVRSELPIGAGFGSSAAVGAAVVASLLALLIDEPESLESSRIEAVALEVERHQHGAPSGVDTASVVRGGRLWVERSDSGALLLETVEDKASILSELEVWNTGASRQSTGEVVSAVRTLGHREPKLFAGVMGEIEDATTAFRGALAAGDRAAFAESMRRAGAALVDLGIVPDPVRRVLRKVHELGGIAKISGAGAVAGDSAGALLVYHPDEPQRALLESAGYRRIKAQVGAPGLEWTPIE